MPPSRVPVVSRIHACFRGGPNIPLERAIGTSLVTRPGVERDDCPARTLSSVFRLLSLRTVNLICRLSVSRKCHTGGTYISFRGPMMSCMHCLPYTNTGRPVEVSFDSLSQVNINLVRLLHPFARVPRFGEHSGPTSLCCDGGQRCRTVQPGSCCGYALQRCVHRGARRAHCAQEAVTRYNDRVPSPAAPTIYEVRDLSCIHPFDCLQIATLCGLPWLETGPIPVPWQNWLAGALFGECCPRKCTLFSIHDTDVQCNRVRAVLATRSRSFRLHGHQTWRSSQVGHP